MSREALDARFEALLARMQSSGVATSLRGCDEAEITALERKHDVTLPYTYRRYLEIMGHDADGLFAHDHVQVTYYEVVELQDEVTERDEDGHLDFVLPAHALVISGRLGEQYLYVVCDGSDDAEVVYVSRAEGVPSRRSHASILEWLEVWLAEAEEVLRDGR